PKPADKAESIGKETQKGTPEKEPGQEEKRWGIQVLLRPSQNQRSILKSPTLTTSVWTTTGRWDCFDSTPAIIPPNRRGCLYQAAIPSALGFSHRVTVEKYYNYPYNNGDECIYPLFQR